MHKFIAQTLVPQSIETWKIGSSEIGIQNLKHRRNVICRNSILLYSPAYSLIVSTLATSEARAGSCSNCICSVLTSTSSPAPKKRQEWRNYWSNILSKLLFENPVCVRHTCWPRSFESTKPAADAMEGRTSDLEARRVRCGSFLKAYIQVGNGRL